MKLFTVEAKCCVCGGPGLARRDQAWLSWGWGRHQDPAVCAMYLRERQEDLERREEALRRIKASEKTDASA